MSNSIAVHKANEEGVLVLNAETGQVQTPADERPEWADGYAYANFKERSDFYTARLGAAASAPLLSKTILDADDLSWIGVDAEGDEVEIEANADFRMDAISQVLGVDREDFDGERNFKNAIASAEVAHTYATEPTSEATLADIEGTSFTETERVAAQG